MAELITPSELAGMEKAAAMHRVLLRLPVGKNPARLPISPHPHSSSRHWVFWRCGKLSAAGRARPPVSKLATILRIGSLSDVSCLVGGVRHVRKPSRFRRPVVAFGEQLGL